MPLFRSSQSTSTTPAANNRGVLVRPIPAVGPGANGAVLATETAVVAANADTQILDEDGTRQGVLLFNESGVAVNVLFASAGAASISAYSVTIGAMGFYEVPPAWVTSRMRGYWQTAPNAADRLRVSVC